MSQLHDVITAAVDAGLVTEEQLALRALELGKQGRPGGTTLRACLATRGSLLDQGTNTFERDFDGIRLRGGFPQPVRQLKVVCDNGRTFYLDFAWPEFGCWGECGSMLAHSTQENLAADLERQNLIIEATGWDPVRVTYRDVRDRPDYVDRRLAARLPRTSAPSA